MRWGWVLLWGTVTLAATAADLRVVYNEDYRPLSYRDGVMKGLLIDLMTDLGRRVGASVVHTGYPWERAQQMVRAGEADAFETVVNADRATYTVASSIPVLTLQIRAATARDHAQLKALQKLTTVSQLLPFHHVNLLGSGWAKVQLTGADVFWTNGAQPTLAMLLAHRADLWVESDVILGYYAQQAGVSDQLILLPATFDRVEFRVQVGKTSPWAARIGELNQALAQMVQDGTVTRILARYGVASVRDD